MLDSLSVYNGDADGTELLIPMTESLYVKAEMCDTEKVVIDLGTGYYGERTVKEAEDFVQRKMKYVKEQTTQLEQKLDVQTRNLEQVTLVLQMKTQHPGGTKVAN